MFDLQRFMGTRDIGTVFDIGANRGQTVSTVLKFAPRATIHGFEPGSTVFAELERAHGARSNVHLHKMALGASRERRQLVVRQDSELNTMVDAAVTADSRMEEIEVSTVDEMAVRLGVDHIDLLKMDVQGWEMEVMRGAAELAAGHRLLFILAEVAFRANEAEMQQFSEFHAHCEKLGFTLCGFYELVRYGPRKEFLLFGNALYADNEARLKWTNLRSDWDSWMTSQQFNRP
jgi:FkbM family methyltransferase